MKITCLANQPTYLQNRVTENAGFGVEVDVINIKS
jgi:hypothetical protein